MALSIGIVGLPNVGKSTLFNALTNRSVPAENYPFCTIDPSVGVVAVPDERVGQLAKLSNSQKMIPAAVEFVDIAGLVAGASAGEGLGNKFLTNIRETDAILEVVRVFNDVDVIHVSGGVDPMRDIEVINLELVLSDMATVTKRRETLGRLVKQQNKDALIEMGILERIAVVLDAGALARTVELTDDEAFMIKSLNLLTMKPILYALNRKTGKDDELFKKTTDALDAQGSLWGALDILSEHDFKGFEGDERKAFREEMGVAQEAGIDTLITKGYELLNLITYFTTGEDETRAWTIKRGWAAPMAGTAIHTDFKDKFIRAEVVAADKLLEAGSYAAAREKGYVRMEGKEYIVKDGDVIEFKI